LKKLPTVAMLNAEYAKLLAEKKGHYSDYKKAQAEMKELLVTKRNIDQLLGTEFPREAELNREPRR
jgi:hypothetical protein